MTTTFPRSLLSAQLVESFPAPTVIEATNRAGTFRPNGWATPPAGYGLMNGKWLPKTPVFAMGVGAPAAQPGLGLVRRSVLRPLIVGDTLQSAADRLGLDLNAASGLVVTFRVDGKGGSGDVIGTLRNLLTSNAPGFENLTFQGIPGGVALVRLYDFMAPGAAAAGVSGPLEWYRSKSRVATTSQKKATSASMQANLVAPMAAKGGCPQGEVMINGFYDTNKVYHRGACVAPEKIFDVIAVCQSYPGMVWNHQSNTCEIPLAATLGSAPFVQKKRRQPVQWYQSLGQPSGVGNVCNEDDDDYSWFDCMVQTGQEELGGGGGTPGGGYSGGEGESYVDPGTGETAFGGAVCDTGFARDFDPTSATFLQCVATGSQMIPGTGGESGDLSNIPPWIQTCMSQCATKNMDCDAAHMVCSPKGSTYQSNGDAPVGSIPIPGDQPSGGGPVKTGGGGSAPPVQPPAPPIKNALTTDKGLPGWAIALGATAAVAAVGTTAYFVMKKKKPAAKGKGKK